MSVTDESRTQNANRAAGALAIAAALTSVVLLALHPGGDARTFADVVRDEAANLVPNLMVHGGMILLLSVQFVAYSQLSARLTRAPFAARAAIIFFGIGALWLSASLFFDGLIMPAVSARYVDDPSKLESARPLFVLIGSMLRYLMPVGLGFLATSLLCWGAALTTATRIWAGVVLLLGVLVAAAVAAGVLVTPMALMGGFVALAIWGLVAGSLLLRKAL